MSWITRIDISRRRVASFCNRVDQVLDKAWLSYLLLTLIQIKVLWGIWPRRDLTTGDTSSYFVLARQWAESFSVNIQFYPLYTSFYGTLLQITNDAYSATTLHRIVIVMTATLAVLALMRKLLPSALALLIASWWAILPINFETLYEIHLFALLPILAAWLVAASVDDPWHRGIALAILFIDSILLRNEMIIATIVFASMCLVRELTAARSKGACPRIAWRTRLAAYGVPIFLAVVLCSFYYWRSTVGLREFSSGKHTVNMCQVYAFGFQQRHPEWMLSPWLDCYGLMTSTFGHDKPTLLQMIKANPQAVWEHFVWNISLIPNGLQTSLFNAMSGHVNPDYAPVSRRPYVVWLSLIAVAVVVWGGVVAVRRREYWWSHWFRKRKGLWLIMLSVLCVSGPVILTQRPRPSYLFSTTLIAMAVIGSAAHVLTHRLPTATRRLAVGGVLLLLIAIPSYYVNNFHGRPLHAAYERIRPFAALLQNRNNRIILGDYTGELQGYLGLRSVTSFDYSLLASRKPEQSLDDFLRERNINVLYVQPRVVNEFKSLPHGSQLLDQPETLGWQKIAPQETTNPTWYLLYRVTNMNTGESGNRENREVCRHDSPRRNA